MIDTGFFLPWIDSDTSTDSELETGRSIKSVGQVVTNPGFHLDDEGPYLAAKNSPYKLPEPPVDYSMELKELDTKLVKNLYFHS